MKESSRIERFRAPVGDDAGNRCRQGGYWWDEDSHARRGYRYWVRALSSNPATAIRLCVDRED